MKTNMKNPLLNKMPAVRHLVTEGAHALLSDDSSHAHHAKDAKLRSNVIKKNHDRKR